MSQPANWALVSTTPCSNDVAGQIALVELMCASDVCNFTMELVTTSNLLSDESDATISLSSGAKFISFPISSSDHPLVITMSANQPSSLTWGCGQATDSMCGDVLLHGDEGRLPVFTSISEPDWFSSASYISQYVIRKPIAGVVYTLYASSDPASNMINQINISRSYTCSDDCIGYGVCLPPSSTSSSDGTCLCSLVGNVTGLQCSQVSLGKSEVKVNDVVAGTLDYLEVTSYSFIVPPDSSSVYEIHLVSAAEYYLGLNCTGKDRSCYTQTMNDVGAGAMKSICPYDHGLWSLTLINRAMPSTYKISLLTSELVVNQIAYNKMLYTEKSENTFIIVADRYMCNPSLTFIGTTTGEKTVGVGIGCTSAFVNTTATFEGRALSQVIFPYCVATGTYLAITTSDDPDVDYSATYQIIFGDSGQCENGCGVNGVCLPDGTCACDIGFSGQFCEQSNQPVTLSTIDVGVNTCITMNTSSTQTYAVNVSANQIVRILITDFIRFEPLYISGNLGTTPSTYKNQISFMNTYQDSLKKYSYVSSPSSSDSIFYFQLTDQSDYIDTFDFYMNVSVYDTSFRLNTTTALPSRATNYMPDSLSIYKTLFLDGVCNLGYVFYITSTATSPITATSSYFSVTFTGAQNISFHPANCTQPVLVTITSSSPSDIGSTFKFSLAQQTCPNGCQGNGMCSAGICQCNDGWNGIDCSVCMNCVKATDLGFCTSMNNNTVMLAKNQYNGCDPSIEYYDHVLLPQIFANIMPLLSSSCSSDFKDFLCRSYLQPCSNQNNVNGTTTSTIVTVPCSEDVTSFFTKCPVDHAYMSKDITSECAIDDLKYLIALGNKGSATQMQSSTSFCKSQVPTVPPVITPTPSPVTDQPVVPTELPTPSPPVDSSSSDDDDGDDFAGSEPAPADTSATVTITIAIILVGDEAAMNTDIYISGLADITGLDADHMVAQKNMLQAKKSDETPTDHFSVIVNATYRLSQSQQDNLPSKYQSVTIKSRLDTTLENVESPFSLIISNTNSRVQSVNVFSVVEVYIPPPSTTGSLSDQPTAGTTTSPSPDGASSIKKASADKTIISSALLICSIVFACLW
eukprot:TRINITY_DN2444_c0_g1_i3.p1 TRINITY_DN2444_c0_g1~~TRINITY_DN2444_c0_g1_i3.p1  ORF type:complete len:1084 (+),score=267.43 TRINITY_DN2444_c0_g1_i3:503-3754(+)